MGDWLVGGVAAGGVVVAVLPPDCPPPPPPPHEASTAIEKKTTATLYALANTIPPARLLVTLGPYGGTAQPFPSETPCNLCVVRRAAPGESWAGVPVTYGSCATSCTALPPCCSR